VHSLQAASSRRRKSQGFVESITNLEMGKSSKNRSLNRDLFTRRSADAQPPVEPFFVARRSIESNSSNSTDSTVISTSPTSNQQLILSNSPRSHRTWTVANSNAASLQFMPTPNAKRTCTDGFFLILLALALAFSGFGLFNAVYVQQVNSNRVLSGHDDWGNVCGQSNEQIDGALWSGQNMTNRRFMLLRLGRNHSVNSICIENCSFNDYL
jgi:hypothetical protein